MLQKRIDNDKVEMVEEFEKNKTQTPHTHIHTHTNSLYCVFFPHQSRRLPRFLSWKVLQEFWLRS